MKLEDYNKEKVLKYKSNKFRFNRFYVPKLYRGYNIFSPEDLTTIIKNNNGEIQKCINYFDLNKEPPEVILVPNLYIPEFNLTQDDYNEKTPNLIYRQQYLEYKKIIKTLKLYPLLRPDFDDYKFMLEVYEYAFHFIKMNILVNVMSISELISWMYEKVEDPDDN